MGKVQLQALYLISFLNETRSLKLVLVNVPNTSETCITDSTCNFTTGEQEQFKEYLNVYLKPQIASSSRLIKRCCLHSEGQNQLCSFTNKKKLV